MDEVGRQVVLGAVRSALVASGGVLATKGYISSTEVELYVGALVVILGAAWSIWDKFHSETKTEAREVDALNKGISYSNADPNPTPLLEPQEAQALIKAAKP